MVNHVWFAPAVLNALSKQRETFEACANCLAQYMQNESKKNGSVNANPEKFESDVRAIVREAVATYNPELKDNLNVQLMWKGDHCDIAVRFNFYIECPTCYLH